MTVEEKMFPKPLHEMEIDELAMHIEKIRAERRKYLAESKKRPQRKAAGLDDPFDRMAKGLSAKERDELIRLLKEKKGE